MYSISPDCSVLHHKSLWADTIRGTGILRNSDRCSSCELGFTFVAMSELKCQGDERRRLPALLGTLDGGEAGCGGAAGWVSALRAHFWGSSFQGLSFFCLTRFTDSCWGEVKSSTLNNLKHRGFCIHSFAVHYGKEISKTWHNSVGLKMVSILLVVFKNKAEKGKFVLVIKVTKPYWNAINNFASLSPKVTFMNALLHSWNFQIGLPGNRFTWRKKTIAKHWFYQKYL